MNDIASQLARLSPEQRALLQRRMAARRPDTTIPHRQDGGPAPLSFAQRRLWFMQHLNPDSTAYNMMTVLRLRGALDVAAMTWAFAALTARHEALRSACRLADDGTPQQLPGTAPGLSLIDPTRWPPPIGRSRTSPRGPMTCPPFRSAPG